MNFYLTASLVTAIIFIGCVKQEQNPFYAEYDTPFGAPPFNLITEDHYLPAFREGIKQKEMEIQAITKNTAEPSFLNTIEALEISGGLLDRVEYVFDNLYSAHTNDNLQRIRKEVAPLLSKSHDDILLNEKLFSRIKSVYKKREELDLTSEQEKLLTEYYKDFVRGGGNLDPSAKQEFRKINEELSLLTINFGENVLKEDNAFKLLIENKQDLAGLPESSILAAAEAATQNGDNGKWLITLHKPSLIPFLQYAQRRELREKMFKAYINRGNNNDEYDNKEVLVKIANLRLKRANLLGYRSHADFVLEERMAKTPQDVYGLLDKVWKPALSRAKSEAEDLQKMITNEGEEFELQPWDWWYYAEKLKKQKYALDDEALRPYFKLENVRNGAFTVAGKLWGISFKKRNDVPVYHEDVEVFEVMESDGSHIGLLYTDYFPRESKRGGAWMNAYRKQHKSGGKNITPIIVNVGNFTKPTAEKPSLLSFEEASTLFHEFGHALHGLLSNCTYLKLSGTSVAWDFVEVPSQIFENWVSAPEVLREYAVHYETGEPIPEDLIQKIKNASRFNQGFATVEYLAASFLDMNWHMMTETTETEPLQFEKQAMDKIGLIPQIVSRYRSYYFRHIFSGDYSAGYYSYIWAEVLDADGFQAFKEEGLFNRERANALRKNILATGGTEDPMVLYKRFRGSEPKIDALLARRGLN